MRGPSEIGCASDPPTGAPSRRRRAPRVLALVLLALLGAACATPGAAPPARFRVEIVDADTGRGIPAVQLLTTDGRSWWSDSAGVVALLDPGLMKRRVFFEVGSFGYRYEGEVEGLPGAAVDVVPGGSARLEMRRENVAERLYRVTGIDVYGDSVLAGVAPPYQPSQPSPRPTGADSVATAVYRDELFWIWGDSNRLSSPFAIFRATGATSLLPDAGGLDPRIGVDLRYFHDRRALHPMVADAHPVVWLAALRSVRNARGVDQLFATYRKVVAPMETVERGLAEYDTSLRSFRLVSAYPPDTPIVPEGHPFRYREDGVAWIQYDMDVRGPDATTAVRDLDAYEAFTPIRPGARLGDGGAALERDGDGKLVWGWKRNAPPISPADWETLVASGAVAPSEQPYRLIDVETGETVVPHNGSVQWNAFRRRWVMIRGQLGGTASRLGEVYYFEGDSPLGPWAYGRKIVTHARTASGLVGRDERQTYSFYNPMQHPEFDRAGGREIFFEGTLSRLFANPAAPRIPGYDYNQMMYALDLEDPRLFLPVAVYRLPGEPPRYRTRDGLPDGGGSEADLRDRRTRLPAAEIAFFAPDRPRPGTVAVREAEDAEGSARLVLETTPRPGTSLFHCAPEADHPPETVPLYEQVDAGGRYSYTTREPSGPSATLCFVWPAPVDFGASLPREAPAGMPRESPTGIPGETPAVPPGAPGSSSAASGAGPSVSGTSSASK